MLHVNILTTKIRNRISDKQVIEDRIQIQNQQNQLLNKNNAGSSMLNKRVLASSETDGKEQTDGEEAD